MTLHKFYLPSFLNRIKNSIDIIIPDGNILDSSDEFAVFNGSEKWFEPTVKFE